MRKTTAAALVALPIMGFASPAGAGTSSAEATAAKVDQVVTISETSADHSDDSSASATGVEVLGENISGGDANGNGDILSTGDTELGSVTVGGWTANTDDDASSATAALIQAEAPQGLASASVLDASSYADGEGASSSSTGLHVNVAGQLDLRVLHAEQSTIADGNSALLIFNDIAIGTSEQFGECELPLDPAIHVICLWANSNEDGTAGGDTGVGDIDGLDGNVTSKIVGASGSSAEDDPTPPQPPIPHPPLEVEDDDPELPVIPRLPRTGGPASLLLIGGSLTGALGALLRRIGLRSDAA